MSHAADGTLTELLSACLEAMDRGEDPEIEVLCQGNDELARTLRKRLRVVRAIDGIVGADSSDTNDQRSHAEGEIVGVWRIGRPLGEGGFGSVYEAHRTDGHDDHAAIKLLHRGALSAEARARFQTEAQALALVRHPNVASILDSGITETGTPYLVLELIEGDAIDRYCERFDLSRTERVRLMLSVCQTIEHAHAKGVLHRDLKPSNVLVVNVGGEHVPKLIDFGIARFIDGVGPDRTRVTAEGQVLGTARYMSPEQLGIIDGAPEANTDTRSDIYSLGVMLYELITGLLPYDDDNPITSVYELQQRMRTTEPRSLTTRLTSRTAPKTARDTTPNARELGWITMRCLEMNPERRYATCRELADDLHRLIAGEAIDAGPRSRMYLTRKFISRHRGLVGAGAVAALGLVVAAIGTSWGLVQARAETARARAAEAESQRIIEFQYDMLRNLDPALVGSSIARETLARTGTDTQSGSDELAASAAAVINGLSMTDVGTSVLGASVFDPAIWRINRDFADSPSLRTRLLSSIGKAQLETGLIDEGLETYRGAYELLLDQLGADAEQTLIVQRDYADALRTANRPDEAIAILEGVQHKLEAQRGEGDADSILAVIDQGSAYYDAQQLDQARERWDSAFELAEANLGHDHELTHTARGNLGLVLTDLGQLVPAEQHLRTARAYWIKRFGLDNQQTVISTDNLARCLVLMGELNESLDLYRDIWDRSERILGKSHPITFRIRSNFIGALFRAEEYQEALDASEANLASIRAELPDDDFFTLMALRAHGKVLIALDRDHEALSLLGEASRNADRVFGPETRYAALLGMAAAEALAGTGDYEGAFERCGPLYSTLSKLLGPDHPETQHAAELAVRVLEAAASQSSAAEPAGEPIGEPAAEEDPRLSEWRARMAAPAG